MSSARHPVAPQRDATMRTFQVARDALSHTRIVVGDCPTPLADQIVLAIDRFALTANNITYGAMGERMNYWGFYPAQPGWGVIPVWGFADVVASSVPAVPVGERYWGYYPMASHVLLNVARAGEDMFSEASPGRQALAAVYNQYLNTRFDRLYDPAREAEIALLRPLFMTAWLIADFLADRDYFGAGQVVLSSASSKTAYSVAHELSRRSAPRPRVVGLTSAQNQAFVEQLGCYDEVLGYDRLGDWSTESRTVYVDMSGDAPLRARLHAQLADRLAYSCSVGATHWRQLGGAAGLPGPAPQLFFAPAQVAKRAADWGAAGLRDRLAEGWQQFLPMLSRSMHVVEQHGADAVTQTYLALLEGRLPPEQGHVLSF